MKKVPEINEVVMLNDDGSIFDHLNTEMSNKKHLEKIIEEKCQIIGDLNQALTAQEEIIETMRKNSLEELEKVRNEKDNQIKELFSKNVLKSQELKDLNEAYQMLEKDNQMTIQNLEEDLQDYKERYEYMKNNKCYSPDPTQCGRKKTDDFRVNTQETLEQFDKVKQEMENKILNQKNELQRKEGVNQNLKTREKNLIEKYDLLMKELVDERNKNSSSQQFDKGMLEKESTKT